MLQKLDGKQRGFTFKFFREHEATGVCNNNDRKGEDDPKSKDNDIGGNTAFGYMMADPDYTFGCCGVIEKWQAMFDNVEPDTRTLVFQVWRPITGSTYRLVGQNSVTVSADAEVTFPITTGKRITVKDQDRIGWWTDGADIITHKDGGNGEADQNNYMALATKIVGDEVDWSGATVTNDRSYGIRADLNPNNDPSFTNLPGSTSITNAAAAATSLVTITVTDTDSYDVDTLDVTMTTNARYAFDTTTKILTTASSLTDVGSTVDRLVFQVVDQCDNTASATFTVTITNDPPVIQNLPASESLSEDVTAETLIFTVTATDSANDVTCSLAAGVPTTLPFLVKQIPSSTDYGIYSKSNPGFDYEATNSYTFNIDCSDGYSSDSEDFTVYLLKNAAPVFVNLQNSTSISTTDPVGTTAFTVLVTDAEGDDLTFTMSCSPSCGPFEIFNSGQIQINTDLTGHTTVGYDLEITVSDSKNTVGPRLLTITLADINDPVILTNLPSTVTITENVAVGTSVFDVSYSDSDASQTRTFAITSSSPTSGTGYFTIDRDTGRITTSALIDYETIAATSFDLSVTVADPVTSDAAALTVIIANENEAPSFGQASYSLSADEGNAGTVIGTPSFGLTDPDNGDSKTLLLDCGAQTGYFYMHPTTWEIKFQSNYDLDANALPTTVPCTVTVTDNGGLTDTATLTITINDVNDNVPIFSPLSYTYYISYYASAGTSVGTVTATDNDAGAYGVITYTLDQSSLSEEYFAIDSSGMITTKIQPSSGSLGYGTSVTITAMASDVGGNEDTATVVIIVSGT
ncbi:cadherin EGF LAG seven-pass G-type receptor 2-like [Mya arenaria]|uniref:cadherin EGF LAG seven-pass G-type receptor 2-like n=1 Tax=Mya arenaria TaxID=6604 RepID=UPI0022E6509D|nr:cadherin EGF LAG seven-pass G-type receptor 2-like [Mya arenaria]